MQRTEAKNVTVDPTDPITAEPAGGRRADAAPRPRVLIADD
jgi:hypothetical protein